jgi:hypothetical protein
MGWSILVAVILLNPFLENYFYLTPSFAAVGFALGRTGLDSDLQDESGDGPSLLHRS